MVNIHTTVASRQVRVADLIGEKVVHNESLWYVASIEGGTVTITQGLQYPRTATLTLAQTRAARVEFDRWADERRWA